MRFLDRYILAEVAAPFIVGVLIILVMLLGDQLYELMRLVIIHGVDLATVTRLLLFVLPEMMVTAFPLATILAVSLGLNRLVRDNEWAMMRLGGLSLARGLVPLHLFGLSVALLTWVVGEWLAPPATEQFERLRAEIAQSNPRVVIEPQRWFRPGEGNSYFYVNSIDQSTGVLYNIVIFTDLGSDYPSALIAKQARFVAGTFVLQNVVRHVWRSDGTLQREGETATARIRINRLPSSSFGIARTAKHMSASQLRSLIGELQGQGIARPDQIVDLQLRYAGAVACYLLAMLCVPLNILTAHRGSFFGLLITVVLAVLYFLSLDFGLSLARNGLLKAVPMLGVWLQNLVFAGLAVVMLRRCR